MSQTPSSKKPMPSYTNCTSCGVKTQSKLSLCPACKKAQKLDRGVTVPISNVEESTPIYMDEEPQQAIPDEVIHDVNPRECWIEALGIRSAEERASMVLSLPIPDIEEEVPMCSKHGQELGKYDPQALYQDVGFVQLNTCSCMKVNKPTDVLKDIKPEYAFMYVYPHGFTGRHGDTVYKRAFIAARDQDTLNRSIEDLVSEVSDRDAALWNTHHKCSCRYLTQACPHQCMVKDRNVTLARNANCLVSHDFNTSPMDKPLGIYNTLNECIFSAVPVHGVLDIDAPSEVINGIEQWESIMQDIIDDVINIYASRYSMTITIDDFQISTCNRPSKYSAHIVIKKGAFRTIQKRKLSSAHDLYLQLHNTKRYVIHGKNILDEGLYSSYHCLRTLHAVKPEYPQYPMIPHGSSSNHAHDHLVNCHCSCSIISIPNDKYTEDTRSIASLFNAIALPSELSMDIILEYIKSKHPTGYIESQNGTSIICNYTDRKEPCCLSGALHDRIGFSVSISGMSAYYRCFSSQCSGMYEYLGPICQNKELMRHFMNKPVEFPNELVIDDRFLDLSIPSINGKVSEWINSKGCLLVKSLYSTGKTQLIKTLVNQPFKKASILFITNRRSLAMSLAKEFPEFHMYMDGLGEYHRKLIIQVESLHKLVQNDVLRSYDLIVLDEIESNLKQLITSPNMKNKQLTLKIAESLLSRASYVLALDSDLSMSSYAFLESFDKPMHVIHRKNSNPDTQIKRTIHITRHQANTLQKVLDDIKEGRNVMLCFLSRSIQAKVSNAIRSAYPSTKILEYSSLSGKDEKALLADVEKNWVDYQVISFTPTISVGIDFSVRNHFHSIYAFSNSDSADAHTLMQMVSRCRHPINQTITICHMGHKNHWGMISKKSFKDEMDRRVSIDEDNEFDDEGYVVDRFSLWTALVSDIRYGITKSRVSFCWEVISIANSNSFDIIDEYQDVDISLSIDATVLVLAQDKDYIPGDIGMLMKAKEEDETTKQENIQLEIHEIKRLTLIDHEAMDEATSNEHLKFFQQKANRDALKRRLHMDGLMDIKEDLEKSLNEMTNIARYVLDLCESMDEDDIHDDPIFHADYHKISAVFGFGIRRGKEMKKTPFEGLTEIARIHRGYLNDIIGLYGYKLSYDKKSKSHDVYCVIPHIDSILREHKIRASI